jgi:hypothetical protein
MDDVDYLAALVSDVQKYPRGIQRVIPGRLQRVAFFPGGTGVVIGDDPATALPGRKLPRGGTMVLGHNFDNVASYEQSIERGREFGWNATWDNLSKLLHSCGIRLSDCFFTNALLGLIETARSTGSHPGHRDPDFREACRRVLLASIERQQPKLILVLGLRAGRILGEVMGLAAWSNAKKFRCFDALLDCLIAVAQCLIGLALVDMRRATASVAYRIFRIELDRLIQVADGAVVVALGRVLEPAVVESFPIFRIELDRLIQVADGAVIVTFGGVPGRAVVKKPSHFSDRVGLLDCSRSVLDRSRPC